MHPDLLALILALLALLITQANSTLIGYGTCQTECSNIVVACYAAAGFVFGAVAAVGAPPAIIACNAAFGKCSAACAATLLVPAPCETN